MSPNCTRRRSTSGVIARSGKSARMASTKANNEEAEILRLRAVARVTLSVGSGGGRPLGLTTDGSCARRSGSSAKAPSSGPDEADRNEDAELDDDEDMEDELDEVDRDLGRAGPAPGPGAPPPPHRSKGWWSGLGSSGLMLAAFSVANRLRLRLGRSTLNTEGATCSTISPSSHLTCNLRLPGRVSEMRTKTR